MNKNLITVGVILLLLAGAVYFFQTGGVSSDNARDSVNRVGDLENWLAFENEEFGFALLYPPTWEAQEVPDPREERAVHEIVFQESEYDPMWRASFTVRSFANPNNLSTEQWWDEWLADEDAKEAACRAEYADTAPCLFLRGLIEKEEKVEFSEKEAIQVTLFRFDHEEECTYVAHNQNVLGMCYAGTNPNNPNAEEHNTIITEMRESFTLQ